MSQPQNRRRVVVVPTDAQDALRLYCEAIAAACEAYQKTMEAADMAADEYAIAVAFARSMYREGTFVRLESVPPEVLVMDSLIDGRD